VTNERHFLCRNKRLELNNENGPDTGKKDQDEQRHSLACGEKRPFHRRGTAMEYGAAKPLESSRTVIPSERYFARSRLMIVI
jgi:hypothetical protein